MKLYHYIMIHCIVPKNINLQKLSEELESHIQKQFPNTQTVLETNKPYQRDPESNSIIYSVFNRERIKVSELLTYFPLSWEYSEGYVYNVELQQRVEDEDSVWSQLSHPKEVFLIPSVRWVHIYTWETIEKPTTN